MAVTDDYFPARESLDKFPQGRDELFLHGFKMESQQHTLSINTKQLLSCEKEKRFMSFKILTSTDWVDFDG